MITKPKWQKKKATLKHLVHEVHKDHLTLMLPNGNTYNTTVDTDISLKLVTPKDTAIIDTNTWKVIDIIKYKPKKEKKLSEEEEALEIKRQEEELLNMGYDY